MSDVRFLRKLNHSRSTAGLNRSVSAVAASRFHPRSHYYSVLKGRPFGVGSFFDKIMDRYWIRACAGPAEAHLSAGPIAQLARARP